MPITKPELQAFAQDYGEIFGPLDSDLLVIHAMQAVFADLLSWTIANEVDEAIASQIFAQAVLFLEKNPQYTPMLPE